METGVYPGAPSYTIWREGSTYYAKNAYGQIPSWGSGANASVIFEYVFLEKGEIFIVAGQYDVDVHLYVTNDTFIHGEGYLTHIHQTVDDGFGAVFFVGPPASVAEEDWNTTSYGHNVIIENLRISSSAVGGSKGNGISILAMSNVIVRNVWLEDLNQGVESHGRVNDIIVSNVFITNTDTFALSFQPSVGYWGDIYDIDILNVFVDNANIEDLGDCGVWLSGRNIKVNNLDLNLTLGMGVKLMGWDITLTNVVLNNTESTGFYTSQPIDAVGVEDDVNSSRIIFDKCKTFNAGGDGFAFLQSNNIGVFRSLIYNVGEDYDGISIQNSTYVTIMGCTTVDDRSPKLMIYDIGGYQLPYIDFISVIGNSFIQGNNTLGLAGTSNLIIRANFNVTDSDTLP